MPGRKVPMRRCVHCGASRPKSELIRVVRTPSGDMLFDQRQRQAGRGAYLCRQPDCIRAADTSRRIGASLGRPLTDELAETLIQACGR